MIIEYKIAEEQDLEEIYSLVKRAIDTMCSQGVFQWDEIYPDREVLADDIRKAQMFLGRVDGQLVVIYVLNQECDEEYSKGEWINKDRSFGVVHRLCVDPSFQHMGIGKFTMQHIEETLRKSGVGSVRLDAFTENPQAIRLYESLGYSRTGYANWRKGTFYLMEKCL